MRKRVNLFFEKNAERPHFFSELVLRGLGSSDILSAWTAPARILPTGRISTQ
jgi:hypothetical protein